MVKSKIKHSFVRVYQYGDYGTKYVLFKYLNQSPRRSRLVAQSEGPFSEEIKAYEASAPTEQSAERLEASISRTRSTIFEIAFCNDFEYFCTFTQDESKVSDRFDLSAFRSRLSQFVRNQNRYRAPENRIEYLFIPEQHKDGAWHIHGLLKGLTENDLKLNEHGYLDWYKYRDRFGFFSCSKIKSHDACSRYVTKYVSKSLCSTKIDSRGHMFFASKGLKRKVCIDEYMFDSSMYDEWDYENDYVKIRWEK